jgi:hypothetical protein
MARTRSVLPIVLLLAVLLVAAYAGLRYLTGQLAPGRVDLTLSLDTKGSAVRDGVLLLEATARNGGPDLAKGVTVKVMVPAHVPRSLGFLSPKSDPTCSYDGGTVICRGRAGKRGGFELQKGQSRTFQLAFAVPQEASCGTQIETTAIVDALATELSPTDNATVLRTNVLCADRADLALTQTGASVLPKDGSAKISFTVANDGPNAAGRVGVHVIVPGGLRFDAFHSDVACTPTRSEVWCGGDETLTGFPLLVEQSRTFTLTFTASPSAECEKLQILTADTRALDSSDLRQGNNDVNHTMMVQCE